MNTYTWTSWTGQWRNIEADHVTFESSHIVFRELDGTLILAVKSLDINNLRRIPGESE